VSAGFVLSPRLAADSIFLADWPLSQIRLLDDSRFPWLMLVPRRPDLGEWMQLGDDDLLALAQEIKRASEALTRIASPDKINVGALGNIVRQLHVHVVARFTRDAAWPGPVWGSGERVPYAPAERDRLCADFMAAFAE
jgi:diadenosine tetraphosphate (Ap4A) HIT family hydrolase